MLDERRDDEDFSGFDFCGIVFEMTDTVSLGTYDYFIIFVFVHRAGVIGMLYIIFHNYHRGDYITYLSFVQVFV